MTDLTQTLTLDEVNASLPKSADEALKILLLEDLDSDAQLIMLNLRKMERKISIKHASNEEEFKDFLDDFKPHAIISDYSLPQYTGMDALTFVRGKNSIIPFILCTGRINEETAVACIKAGADDYVLKDSMSRLVHALEVVLENKELIIEKIKDREQLQKSEENFRALAENAPDNIYKLGKDGIILYVNRDIENIELDNMIGSSIYEYISDKNESALKSAITRAWIEKSKQTVEIEGSIENSDWYYCRIGPVLKDGEVESLIFIPSNISDKKKAEIELNELNTRLQDLTQHLETIRDEEKKRIAMEIHDQLGQELTGNKLGLFWIQQHLKQNGIENADEGAIQEKITDLVELTTQTIKTVRRIAHELRPVVLDDIGLIPALEWHVENYNKNHETQVELDIETENLNFEKDLSTAIYRITQEALTNVNRHAKAENVKIDFFTTDQDLILEIKDDGIGIDIEKASKSKHLGLFGIRERIKNWNGEIDISGSQGKGTHIKIVFNKKNLNHD